MKKLVVYFYVIVMCLLCSKCTREGTDCNDGSIFVENLVSITPIQSQFQVNDTLTISCSIPSSNDFYGFDVNILEETSNPRARYSLVSGAELIGSQELIIRKGERDGPFFVAVYDAACDCYEFEADLVLTEITSYNLFIGNAFDFIGEGCDRFFIESDFQWVNTPGVI